MVEQDVSGALDMLGEQARSGVRVVSIAVAAGVPVDELGSLVHRSGIGELDADGNHVHVHIQSVRRLAGGRTAGTWDAGFDAMIAYARTKGWVDDAGDTVRAHLEPG